MWDEVYVPGSQGNSAWGVGYVIVKSQLDSEAVDRVLRKEIRSVWPQWVEDPLQRATSMDQLVSESFAAPRFSATVIAAFSTNALLLTAVGVFGLVAYSVSLRRSEFGIRAALGAHSRDLLIMTIRSVLTSTVAGVIVGTAMALYLTRFINGELYGLAPHPAAFVGAALVMLAVAVAAAYVPARRAALVDPLVALRYE
jgi:putative ABC transport system permease protein